MTLQELKTYLFNKEEVRYDRDEVLVNTYQKLLKQATTFDDIKVVVQDYYGYKDNILTHLLFDTIEVEIKDEPSEYQELVDELRTHCNTMDTAATRILEIYDDIDLLGLNIEVRQKITRQELQEVAYDVTTKVTEYQEAMGYI